MFFAREYLSHRSTVPRDGNQEFERSTNKHKRSIYRRMGRRGVCAACANERIEHYQKQFRPLSGRWHTQTHTAAACVTAENARDTRCTQMFMTVSHTPATPPPPLKRWRHGLIDVKHRRVLHACVRCVGAALLLRLCATANTAIPI